MDARTRHLRTWLAALVSLTTDAVTPDPESVTAEEVAAVIDGVAGE